eukprot:GHVR01123069.1.p1 GENE.GHVR01123069.1~~GHVR01123069.1.p1  ORF type:complete len:157 (+),score=33.41 GHVR01123069.1:50-520(+)
MKKRLIKGEVIDQDLSVCRFPPSVTYEDINNNPNIMKKQCNYGDGEIDTRPIELLPLTYNIGRKEFTALQGHVDVSCYFVLIERGGEDVVYPLSAWYNFLPTISSITTKSEDNIIEMRQNTRKVAAVTNERSKKLFSRRQEASSDEDNMTTVKTTI